MSKNSSAEAALGYVLLILMIPIGVICEAVAIVNLWAWFVVPLGVVSIGFAHAIGLGLVISAFIKRDAKTESDEEIGEVVGRGLGKLILAPLFVLFLGWIVHLCM